MDNVIQYIGLSELIPGEFHPHLETTNDNLENLTNSIKKYGILEPLIVRPKDKRYEIILGNRRYKAACILGLQKVPAIILNIDDKESLELVISDNIQRKELSSKEEAYLYNKALSYSNTNKEKLSMDLGIPLDRISSKLNLLNKNKIKEDSLVTSNVKQSANSNIMNNSINNDIINLSELNKEEKERDDFNMNNNQYPNNNLINDNINNQGGITTPNQQSNQQEPTFGGRFFPSLEDEPTNMNLNPSINMNPSPIGTSTNYNSSPLIDLTDLSTEHSQTPSPALEQTPPSTTSSTINNEPSSIPLDPLNTNPTPMSNINIEPPQPTIPTTDVNSIPNQLNNQPAELNQNIPYQQGIINNAQNNININPLESDMQQPELPPQNSTIPTMPNIDQIKEEPPMNIDNIPDLTIPDTINSTTTNANPIQSPNLPKKDIIPVANMIKNLAIGIGEFGYKINITENDSDISYSITIEVEK